VSRAHPVIGHRPPAGAGSGRVTGSAHSEHQQSPAGTGAAERAVTRGHPHQPAGAQNILICIRRRTTPWCSARHSYRRIFHVKPRPRPNTQRDMGNGIARIRIADSARLATVGGRW